MIRSRSCLLLACTALGLAVAPPAGAATAARVFVASYGVDTTNPCTLALPCRTFAYAVTAVAAGGEVVALDSAGYGAVTITQSVTLTAPPGIYGGVAVASGVGVTIATAGVEVTLSGLTINGQGGTNGVYMSNGSSLTLENCVISNFTGSPSSVTTGVGIAMTATQASLRVSNTMIRNNSIGIYIEGGTASISRARIYANTTAGIAATNASTAAITDSVVDGNGFAPSGGLPGYGIEALGASGNVSVSVTRTTVSNNENGVGAWSIGGNALVTIGGCLIAENVIGVSVGNAISTGTFAVESIGNNEVRQNGTNVGGVGVLTNVAPM